MEGVLSTDRITTDLSCDVPLEVPTPHVKNTVLSVLKVSHSFFLSNSSYFLRKLERTELYFLNIVEPNCTMFIITI